MSREQRVYAAWKKQRGRMRTGWDNGGWLGSWGETLWMPIARKMRMPISEVKRVVAEERRKRDGN